MRYVVTIEPSSILLNKTDYAVINVHTMTYSRYSKFTENVCIMQSHPKYRLKVSEGYFLAISRYFIEIC